MAGLAAEGVNPPKGRRGTVGAIRSREVRVRSQISKDGTRCWGWFGRFLIYDA